MFSLTELNKTGIEALSKQLETSPASPLITFDDLDHMLSQDLQELVKKYLELKPSDIGLNNKYLGIEDIPKVAQKVKNQSYFLNGEKVEIDTQYVPSHVYEAYTGMNSVFERDNEGRSLLIESAYRSPAKQVLVFLYWLYQHDFDVEMTTRRVALPAYSQHCSASHTALDLINVEGSPTVEESQMFAETLEYKWLKNHARTYGFAESYPPGNSEGIIWEPWHWQFVGKNERNS